MPGEPLVPKEWLGQVIFALAYQAAGMNGVAWLTAFVLALTFAILTYCIQASGVPAPIAGVAGYVASIVSSIHKLARVHLLSWLAFVVCLSILEDYRRTRDRRKLLFLAPLIVVWANMHGAFIMGLMLAALYAVGALLEKQWRRFGIVYRVYRHGRIVVSQSGGRTTRVAQPGHIVLLAAWTAFALYTARNIPLYAIVAIWMITPVAVEELAILAPRLSRSLKQMDNVVRKTWGWHGGYWRGGVDRVERAGREL